jgi:FKBP-type peptidyl-prolyl cis-trans isomerase 2
VQFPVNRVVRGWAEALLQMKAGSKWQLFIPPTLAFGSQAQSGITPYSTIILEVELLEVQKAQPAAALPQVQPQPATRQPQQVTSDIVGVQGTNIQIIRAQDLLRTNTNAAPR